MTVPSWQVDRRVGEPKAVTARPLVDHAAALLRLVDEVLGPADGIPGGQATADPAGTPRTSVGPAQFG